MQRPKFLKFNQYYFKTMATQRKIKVGFNPLIDTQMYCDKEIKIRKSLDEDHLKYAIELAKKGLNFRQIKEGVNEKFGTDYSYFKIQSVTKNYRV